MAQYQRIGVCFTANHTDMQQERQRKKGRSKPLALSISIKRLNDENTNPKMKCNMYINTYTSAADTIQEEYSIKI